jgi:tetratricopeptide (TPR) repeat protein
MNEEHFLAFDEYLRGEMTDEDKLVFEKQLRENTDFASDFGTFKELNSHLNNKFGNAQELKAFKENLKNISKPHFEKPKGEVVFMKPWYYGVAASVAVLIGLFFLNQNSDPTFEEYNHPETAFFTERGATNDTLKLAQDAFNAKRYKGAIPLFETILKTNNSAEIQYFYGMSLLEVNRLVEADAIFTTLKSGNSIYKDKATWRLALSQLKRKKEEECKKLLLTIPHDFEDYDQVESLLKKLD